MGNIFAAVKSQNTLAPPASQAHSLTPQFFLLLFNALFELRGVQGRQLPRFHQVGLDHAAYQWLSQSEAAV